MKLHHYTTEVTWEGNLGKDTSGYTGYSRDHVIQVSEKMPIPGSSDPSFRGDPKKHNPEELFLSSLSSCHMLWYLHLCSEHKILVVSYTDKASGVMKEHPDGSGQFKNVTLRPRVVIRDPAQIEKARQLHQSARKHCFIANSCNFPIEHEPDISALTQSKEGV